MEREGEKKVGRSQNEGSVTVKRAIRQVLGGGKEDRFKGGGNHKKKKKKKKIQKIKRKGNENGVPNEQKMPKGEGGEKRGWGAQDNYKSEEPEKDISGEKREGGSPRERQGEKTQKVGKGEFQDRKGVGGGRATKRKLGGWGRKKCPLSRRRTVKRGSSNCKRKKKKKNNPRFRKKSERGKHHIFQRSTTEKVAKKHCVWGSSKEERRKLGWIHEKRPVRGEEENAKGVRKSRWKKKGAVQAGESHKRTERRGRYNNTKGGL